VGADAADLGVDLVVAVGEGTAPLADGARVADGDGTAVLHVPDVDAARTLLDERLRPGDVVLLKGSNGSGIWRLADALLEGTTGRAAS
jgi:UDP-N-acetylmuramoyl-tripeptide--D-alanyl-D-alanine ligase